jgi:hypothetical protein
MTKYAFILVLLGSIVFNGVSAAEQKGQGQKGKVPAYDPLILYPGEHQADVLLFRNPGSIVWQRIPRLDQLRNLSCKDALDHLMSEGKWQGHLRPDGSCGSPAEPSDWIMGNRLNYEDALEQNTP